MKPILALDISRKATGWAFGIPGDLPISGVTTFGAPGTPPDDCWRAAMVWLAGMIDTLKPGIVAIEAPIMTSGNGFTNPDTQMMLLGLQVAMRLVVKAKLPGRAQLVNVASARKRFTGRGTYAKNEAKPAVQARCLDLNWLTVETMEENRADALCVFAFVAAQESPDFSLSLNFKSPRRAAKAAPAPAIEF